MKSKTSPILGKPRPSLKELNLSIMVDVKGQRAIRRAIHILQAVNTSPAHAASWSREASTTRVIKALERIVNRKF